MAPFQVVHGSDLAAWGHWAAPGCGDGGAGFAFYVQSVHFLQDNKNPLFPLTISLPVIVTGLHRAVTICSEETPQLLRGGQHWDTQLLTTSLAPESLLQGKDASLQSRSIRGMGPQGPGRAKMFIGSQWRGAAAGRGLPKTTMSLLCRSISCRM